jgi:hypothetical protein
MQGGDNLCIAVLITGFALGHASELHFLSLIARKRCAAALAIGTTAQPGHCRGLKKRVIRAGATICDQRANLNASMMIARIPSATAINSHGAPERRGRAGSCNMSRAIRDGVGGGPAALSSASKREAGGSSADTLSPVTPRSIS